MPLMILIAAVGHSHAADPGTAGYSKQGFSVADAAGKNNLNLGFSFQPRFSLTMNGDPDATDAEALSDTGFRVRRMLFTANGTVAGRLDYKFRVDAAKAITFNDADGKSQTAAKPLLDDAQVTLRAADSFAVSIGQWKVPFTSQQMASDTTLLFPERALPLDGLKYGDAKVSGLKWDRDTGAAVSGHVAEKRFEYQAGVFNGDGANVWPPVDRGFLYVGRVAVAPLGEFKYDEVDLDRGKPRLGVGAAVSMNDHPSFNDSGARDGSTTDLRLGGELRFQASGLSLNGDFVYGTTSPADGTDSVRAMGYYAQAGYCLAAGIAPGIRYSRLDPDTGAEDDGVTQIEGVVNYYLPDFVNEGKNLGHRAQVQLAYTHAMMDGLDHGLFDQVTLATALTF